ncbi:hypothetical protein M3610_26045 [Neobacillus sp. MER 74]|uniref:hypothetical protein n=1 Tax=Neobacillus sp. MER 74 TaxID=2939566 RepID=UPI002041C67F|nr:hypothetical protein [Neobacillus sp. MER 74]MCM3118651.1 hypothetical protein [Neobacillus sp. MER 74]
MAGLKSGNIEEFEQFSQFTSLKELNSHIERWLTFHKQDFSKGELVGLKRLVRFSAKIPGVCNAKIGTVLKAIHEEYNHNGISRSTFKRMIQKAKELGILTVYETERKNGSQSSNLYIINRFPSNELPKEEILNHPKETNNLSKTEKDQKIKERKEEASELDHTYVSDRVPQPFVQLVKCFFPEAKTIEEYWRTVNLAASSYEGDLDIHHIQNVAIQSFKQLIRKLKFSRNVKNPFAYFYGIAENKFCVLFHQLLKDKYDLNDTKIEFRLGLDKKTL